MSEEEKNKFLIELRGRIKNRQITENYYKVLRLVLMVSIAVCGFLTAASSQTTDKDAWLKQSSALLIIGLISTVCAILNQTLNPSEKSTFHKNVKKAFQKIDYAVEGDVIIDKSEAAKLKLIAITDPEVVFTELGIRGAAQN